MIYEAAVRRNVQAALHFLGLAGRAQLDIGDLRLVVEHLALGTFTAATWASIEESVRRRRCRDAAAKAKSSAAKRRRVVAAAPVAAPAAAPAPAPVRSHIRYVSFNQAALTKLRARVVRLARENRTLKKELLALKRKVRARLDMIRYCLLVCLFVCVFVCLFVWLFACLLVCLFVCLLICWLVCLRGCLLVCLFIVCGMVDFRFERCVSELIGIKVTKTDQSS